MSGTPDPAMTPEEREALAGEFVLGTLEAGAAAAVAAALPRDAALRAAVAAWEARLAPLAGLAPPEAPPPDLWARIEASLPPVAASPGTGPRLAAAPPRAAWRAPAWLWRGWAVGSTALAAGLAALLLLRPAEPPRLMTVLLTQTDQPAWLVEAEGDALRLAALNPRPVASDRVLQLWALPPGATAPVSLGLIPPQGRLTVSPGGLRPQPGMLIEITLEPPGGSPLPRPSGPILFIGRLAPAAGS
ncbi:anti-sigma factor domain-containing protein [Pseudoroseomonas cervicalis]|uniref:anti-sigma factor n=1 Tax=Teichococcus cervicalis TaxID=204525 RepID=UPI0022F1AD6A|nr:anti-sigma factor [Pseudoroseomonas cervicalis]WBV42496.1 anti-sigma factor [Pseudoroseomonas cervicalis]